MSLPLVCENQNSSLDHYTHTQFYLSELSPTITVQSASSISATWPQLSRESINQIKALKAVRRPFRDPGCRTNTWNYRELTNSHMVSRPFQWLYAPAWVTWGSRDRWRGFRATVFRGAPGTTYCYSLNNTTNYVVSLVAEFSKVLYGFWVRSYN